MPIDQTIRKLNIPPRYRPYLEKHRIYDLIHSLGTLLGLERPKDHIFYLRNILSQLDDNRDPLKLIIIAPPFMDKRAFVEELSRHTGQIPISRNDFSQNNQDSAETLAFNLFKYIKENDILKKGWIFYDYPSTKMEAKAMLAQGIVPVHTFLMIPSSKASTPEELWLNDLNEWTTTQIRDAWNHYQKHILNLRQTLQATLREINMNCKKYPEIIEECVTIQKSIRQKGPPIIPRVLLIGPRGSRRSEIAKIVCLHLNIELVDMNVLIKQASLAENSMGEQIRFLNRKKVPIYASIIVKILKERLLQEDCISKGWLLIRFPRDCADLGVLDSFDTPPNRIVFLSVNSSECLKMLKEIRISKYTGTVETLAKIEESAGVLSASDYFIHPTDDEKKVLAEQERYSAAIKEMMEYCGESCCVIDGRGQLSQVAERVEHYVVDGQWIGSRAGLAVCSPPCLSPHLSYQDIGQAATTVCSKVYLAKEATPGPCSKTGPRVDHSTILPLSQITIFEKLN